MPSFCSSASNVILTIGVVVLGLFLVQHTSDFEAEEYVLSPPPKLEGPLAPNNHLRNAKLLLNGQISGPESILVEGETLYTGTWDAKIVKIVNGLIEKTVRLTKRTDCDGSFESEPVCGRPLGIRRLNSRELIVIDAYLGIFVVDFDKEISRQVFSNATEIEGRRSTFFNDLDIFGEEMDEIFFTVSSTTWDRRRIAYEYLSHKPDGFLAHLQLSTGKTKILIDGLSIANGVQVLPDKKSVIVVECGMARIWRYYLAGPKKGQKEIFVANLPGFPDNVRLSISGTLYVGIASPRHADAFSLVDKLGSLTWLRKLIVQLVPEKLLTIGFAKVKLKYGIIVELDTNGKIIGSIHDPGGQVISEVSQVADSENFLYLGSFHAPFIAQMPKKLL